MQRIIHQYAIERLLYRLSQSPHRGEFILKGAMLFLLWKDKLHRLTRDLDLLSRGEVSRKYLMEIFRYLCRECRQTFSETRGTFFFGLITPREKVLIALTMIAEGGGIRATGRALGVDKDTVQRWVERAGKHVEEVSAYLTVDCQLSEAQLDALWTFVKKKTGGSSRRTIRRKRASSSSGAA